MSKLPRSPALDARARANQPLGMPPARFLRDYWQQRPLLIRGAFAGMPDPLTPEDLAGLACEELALSRLVMHAPGPDRWTLRSGPFTGSDFAALPKTHWTLLVQDVDKWDADVAALLAHFDFLPSWRVDDIMVSYAVDGGSVGAHVDQYDVFLLQGQGRRRWRISTDAHAPKVFRDDVELKLLRRFVPTHEWLLAPGDMLYLPPGVPHHGIAVGPCLTFSIGMRAPAVAEMLADFAGHLAERLPEDRRYADPRIAPARATGEIDDASLQRVAQALRTALEGIGLDRSAPRDSRAAHAGNGSAVHARNESGPRDSIAGEAFPLRGWFGSFITRYRAAHDAVARERPLTHAAFERKLAAGAGLLPNPWSRFAWSKARRDVALFVGGEQHVCPRVLAERLCERRPLAVDEIARVGAPGRELLLALVNAGHLVLTRPRRKR